VIDNDSLKGAIESIASKLEISNVVSTMVAGMHNLISAAYALSNVLPAMSTSIKEPMKANKYSVVHPTYVRSKIKKIKEMDLETVINPFGS